MARRSSPRLRPAFVGQFGGKGNVDKLRQAFKELGFSGMEEVALGADLCAVQEAGDFLEEVPEKIPFMGTSCCPAWSVMAKMEFPEHADCISMALTPMTLTARLIRKQHPDAKIVFVGPCSAKKLEAQRKSVKSEVDFVLTFEEMAGMMEAKGIDYTKLEGEGSSDFEVASTDGRNFAVAGGVANAVVNAIHRDDPSRIVKIANAEGLDNCPQDAEGTPSRGKYDGYLLEGMASPGRLRCGRRHPAIHHQDGCHGEGLRQEVPAQERAGRRLHRLDPGARAPGGRQVRCRRRGPRGTDPGGAGVAPSSI